MSFVSPIFFLFLPLVLLAAAVLGGRARIVVLTLASYAFYAYGHAPYVLILAFSTAVDYQCGARCHAASQPRVRQFWLMLSVLCNLGLLSYFKYAEYFAQILADTLATAGVAVDFGVPSILLPIGISFYTFQSMSYTIDIYRREIKPVNSFIEFAHFVSFFPQLVAGPIVRAAEFLPQIKRARPLRRHDSIIGMELILLGFFKKVCIADNLAPVVDAVYAAPATADATMLWFATFCFAVQIYCDFSGYTDIARGLGRIFGYQFPRNFTWPYFSQSMKEFWRRWHRTLSFFIRDYVYFSLGGSRGRAARVVAVVFFTWFVSGLWHGASTNFVVWGLYHGLMVSLVDLAARLPQLDKLLRVVPLPIKIAITFVLTLIGWVFFRASSTETALTMLSSMFTPGAFHLALPGVSTLTVVLLGALGLIHWLTWRCDYDAENKSVLLTLSYPLRVTVSALAIALIMVFAGESTAFIYFAF